MPAKVTMVTETANIVAGHGDVSIGVALATLAAAPGIAYAVKKLHIYEKMSPVEQHEIELLDAAAPSGWWRRFKDVMPAVAMRGHKLQWEKGDWSVGTADNGDVLVTTPMLDEETGELVS